MLSLFGLRKDAKKPTSDKEVDGGFVIVGETADEQRRKMQTINIVQPSTNVIVQRSKPSCPSSAQPTNTKVCATAGAADLATSLPDLLGDVPFTLAPHVQAVQAGLPLISDMIFSNDIKYNLAHFQYDFTLENSVLHDC
ncbi:UBAP1-MVB12-associated (UMA)-domain containing protein 1 [Betta splendens]|uniref:UBAP1-MVB12-associated (UMA)-domain containing protein 1 n=1 Tax=Betta splendens TaxID=158456 RepID=A0A6P7NQD0_BETSP|nr:UBAP1-MVB12-associated (UMA)-domain containing protein 1 [Betta splendens]